MKAGHDTYTVGIIMNGVTGRMGMNQHLMRSIVAIIRHRAASRSTSGSASCPTRSSSAATPRSWKRSPPRPAISAGPPTSTRRSPTRTTAIYFDAQTTDLRAPSVKKAIAAGKHIYCEKPAATDHRATPTTCIRSRNEAGVKHGVVQDKLWLPGLLKLKLLIDTGFFGRILSVRGEFGYWVFEGDTVPAQRPSWNYRKEDGGGIIVDMLCHWRYVLDNLFGNVKAVSCLGATHIPTRWDENGQAVHLHGRRCRLCHLRARGRHHRPLQLVLGRTRVRRDDLLTLQVDGTRGSAVAGLRHCWIQPYDATPRPVWNPDIDNPINFFDNWVQVPVEEEYDNAFKVQWELFLRHVV